MKTRNAVHAFTLIELLVVIAIIGILAAMLLPALAGAKDRTKKMKCINNAKQMTAGLQMYCDENEEFLPDYGRNFNYYFWYHRVLKYAGWDHKLLMCPGITVKTTGWWGSHKRSWQAWNRVRELYNGRTVPGAYAYNGWLHSNRGQWDTRYNYKMEDGKPSSTPTMTDAMWVDAWPTENNAPPPSYWGGNNSSMARVCVNRHDGTVVSGFKDGRADSVRLPDLWTLTWHLRWNRSTPNNRAPMP